MGVEVAGGTDRLASGAAGWGATANSHAGGVGCGGLGAGVDMAAASEDAGTDADDGATGGVAGGATASFTGAATGTGLAVDVDAEAFAEGATHADLVGVATGTLAGGATDADFAGIAAVTFANGAPVANFAPGVADAVVAASAALTGGVATGNAGGDDGDASLAGEATATGLLGKPAGNETFPWVSSRLPTAGRGKPAGMDKDGGAARPTMVWPAGFAIDFPVVGQMRVSGRCCF